MDRRDAACTFAVLGATAFRAMAQPSPKAVRVGFLYFGSRKAANDTGRFEAFRKGMKELGYIEGANLSIEARFAESNAARIGEVVNELLRFKPDVIVATGSPTYCALAKAAANVPVVVTVTVDPVAEGMATTVARPGGNFTGLTDTALALGPKQLEILVAAVPRITRIAILQNPDNTSHPLQVEGIAAEARRIGKQVRGVAVRTSQELENGFETMMRERVDALIVLNYTFFTDQIRAIAELTRKHRLPAAYSPSQFAENGGLISYGADLTENFRRAARYVDRILKGARPAELPFEQPTKYAMIINRGSAKALGVTIPAALLLRADQVID